MVALKHLVLATAAATVARCAPLRLRATESAATSFVQIASNTNATGGDKAGQVDIVTQVIVNGVKQPEGIAGDVVTVQTWSFLKDSMEKIRNEVKEIMSIRDDVGMLQNDLKSQEGMWRTAEKNLQDENAALQKQAEELKLQVQAGEGIRAEVQGLKIQIAEAKQNSDASWNEAHHEHDQMMFEQKFYGERREKLVQMMKDLNSTIADEVAKAHEKQLQLETDGVALKVKAGELQDRVNNGAKELMLQEDKASAKTLDLQRQISGMHDGMSRVQNDMAGKGAILAAKGELQRMKVQLNQEISSMVTVKEEQGHVVAQCTKERNARHSALIAEQAKAQRREREMQELCQPVNGQLMALKEMFSHCKALEQGVAPATVS